MPTFIFCNGSSLRAFTARRRFARLATIVSLCSLISLQACFMRLVHKADHLFGELQCQ